MAQVARGTGLVAAGLGWGIAIGVALGALIIAPAVDGTLENGHVFSRGSADGAANGSGSGEGNRTGSGEGGAQDGTALKDQPAQRQAGEANELLADASSQLVKGALDGRSVLIISTASASDEDTAAVRWLANKAGASDAGGFRLTEKFTDQQSADELSSIIANTLPAGAQLSVENRSPGTHAGESLGAAVAIDPSTGSPAASGGDRALVLGALEQAGFVDSTRDVNPADMILVVTGDAGTADGSGDTFGVKVLTDFAAALSGHCDTVLASQGEAADVAGDDGASVATVGDVDTEAGRIRTVLAAGKLAEQQGQHQ